MEEKFLYYLGAGASAEALPIIKTRFDKNGNVVMNSLLDEIKFFSKEIQTSQFISDKQRSFLDSLGHILNNVYKEGSRFATIDTYMKYLYLTNRAQYDSVRKALALFFTFYQLWNNAFDKRYLSWLTSVLSEYVFPKNIKILSWNYDFQMQLAAESFSSEQLNGNSLGYIHTPPFIDYWPKVAWSGSPEDIYDRVSLIHLNGLSSVFYNKKTDQYDNLMFYKEQIGRESEFDFFTNCYGGCVFDYAWESGNKKGYVIDQSQKMIKGTSIMVVIGYSFPFFNRDVDKKVFEELKSSNKLRKIYFQDPHLDGSFLRAQFDLDDKIEIIHRKEVDSFYIPFEL